MIPKEAMNEEPVKKLLEILNSGTYRKEIARFSGNDYRDMGKILMEV